MKKYFDSIIDPSTIEVTQEEVRAQYDAIVASNPDAEDIPSFEEVADNVEQLTLDQKRKEAVEEVVNELKEAAEIIEN